MQILKSWVLSLRIGNDPTPEAEKEAMRALMLDLLNELEHGKN